MAYDFSKVERKNTDCLKFDFAVERGHKADCLSYWVADMDFKTAPEILEALHKRVEHGVFGYTAIKPHYVEAVRNWVKTHHNYDIKSEWLIETPGVVFAIAAAVRAFSDKGDGVLIQSPVYYPFSNTIKNLERKLVSSPLVWKKDENGFGSWQIDFDDFEQKIKQENVKLFSLCNPHNPGGRVWTKTELERIADICIKNSVIVFSDEIHSDFVWEPNRHTVFASISKEAEAITVTATSPSKTFNLAGLQVSNIFISDITLRHKFMLERNRTGYDEPNILGLTACEASYTSGDAWLKECKNYIFENLCFASDFLNSSGLPLKAAVPEGTYLLWVDCSALPFDDAELNRRLTENGNLWLDPGNIFGKEGEMFQRINVATSREYLEKGLRSFVESLRHTKDA